MRLLAARRAGVLLHPTSLPGSSPRGTLGADARRFVDWLVAGGFSVWQTLPLGVTDAYGSPYGQRSAYAGDPRFIDAADLATLEDLPERIDAAGDRDARYESFAALATPEQKRTFAAFVAARRRWLLPYALFEVLAARFGAPWWEWPVRYRDREPAALRECLAGNRAQFRALLFEQYLFELQWSALKRFANERGVYLFGDLPFYVDRDSVEVWWARHLFAVTADGEPLAVAGVPPDYFNADGQLWGNPLYDWEALERTGFRWWLERIATQLERFDLLRIDHFRALESYWEIPAGAATAKEGRWRRGRGDALLAALRARLGADVPLVAEDLGIITDEVRALRDRFELPGMVVLQFAFDGSPDNPHLPQHHRRNAVVYTGTHDNDTTVGWYASLGARARDVVHRMLGVGPAPRVPDFLIDAAYASNAALAVIPMQDLLACDSRARMNTPGTLAGNWRWRFDWTDVPETLAAACRERAVRSGRLNGAEVTPPEARTH